MENRVVVSVDPGILQVARALKFRGYSRELYAPTLMLHLGVLINNVQHMENQLIENSAPIDVFTNVEYITQCNRENTKKFPTCPITGEMYYDPKAADMAKVTHEFIDSSKKHLEQADWNRKNLHRVRVAIAAAVDSIIEIQDILGLEKTQKTKAPVIVKVPKRKREASFYQSVGYEAKREKTDDRVTFKHYLRFIYQRNPFDFRPMSNIPEQYAIKREWTNRIEIFREIQFDPEPIEKHDYEKLGRVRFYDGIKIDARNNPDLPYICVPHMINIDPYPDIRTWLANSTLTHPRDFDLVNRFLYKEMADMYEAMLVIDERLHKHNMFVKIAMEISAPDGIFVHILTPDESDEALEKLTFPAEVLASHTELKARVLEKVAEIKSILKPYPQCVDAFNVRFESLTNISHWDLTQKLTSAYKVNLANIEKARLNRSAECATTIAFMELRIKYGVNFNFMQIVQEIYESVCYKLRGEDLITCPIADYKIRCKNFLDVTPDDTIAGVIRYMDVLQGYLMSSCLSNYKYTRRVYPSQIEQVINPAYFDQGDVYLTKKPVPIRVSDITANLPKHLIRGDPNPGITFVPYFTEY